MEDYITIRKNYATFSPIPWADVGRLGSLPLHELAKHIDTEDYLALSSGWLQRIPLSKLKHKKEVIRQIEKYNE
jgi:hypothetical protein